MNKTIGEFLSVDQTHKLRSYRYVPEEGPVRAVLQISHGMCEYIERYEAFAAYLCEHGFAVCGNDHLGHGELAQQSDTLGWFADRDGWRLPSADLRTLTLQMQKEYPGLPYFLLGHSMGSFIARRYLTESGELLTGAVIMGTSGPNPAATIGVCLANRILRRRGPRYRSSFLTNISTGGYNKRFAGENDKNSWLSKDAALRAKYAADPLCSFGFTAAGHRDLFTLLRSVSSPAWAEEVPKHLPVLLTSGADDPVGQCGKGVAKVAAMLKQAGVTDVTLKLYEGDRHEILNELDRETVYADLLHWFESKMAL